MTQRLPAFPQIPTMAEHLDGLYVPAKIPQSVVEVLAKSLAQAAGDPSVVGAAIERAGIQVDFRDAEGTRKLLETEHAAVRVAAQKLRLGN